MAKRGRKPKTPKAKRLAGTYGNCETTQRVIEAPRVSLFDAPPDWFSVEAADEWRRLVPLLKMNGLLDDLYFGLLTILCVQAGRFVQKLKIDAPMTAAEVTELRRLYAEFNLTPATLPLPTANEPEQENPFLADLRDGRPGPEE